MRTCFVLRLFEIFQTQYLYVICAARQCGHVSTSLCPQFGGLEFVSCDPGERSFALGCCPNT